MLLFALWMLGIGATAVHRQARFSDIARSIRVAQTAGRSLTAGQAEFLRERAAAGLSYQRIGAGVRTLGLFMISLGSSWGAGYLIGRYAPAWAMGYWNAPYIGGRALGAAVLARDIPGMIPASLAAYAWTAGGALGFYHGLGVRAMAYWNQKIVPAGLQAVRVATYAVAHPPTFVAGVAAVVRSQSPIPWPLPFGAGPFPRPYYDATMAWLRRMSRWYLGS